MHLSEMKSSSSIDRSLKAQFVDEDKLLLWKKRYCLPFLEIPYAQQLFGKNLDNYCHIVSDPKNPFIHKWHDKKSV